MKTVRLILGDQLSTSISSLKDYDSNQDIVLMAEVWDEATYVRHHKKKIAFVFSAMRHFCHSLSANGYQVEYSKLDDLDNSGSLKGELKRALKKHQIEKIIITEPGEYRLLVEIKQWQAEWNIPVEIRTDDRFICSIEEFNNWIKNRKQPRMEYFYREMRKKHGILMDSNDPNQPIGGQWNYDAQNRKPAKEGLHIPKRYQQKIDSTTEAVIELVEKKFPNHFGDLADFDFAVSRSQALKALELFITERLEYFGDYQDAMIEGEPWIYHSHISFYLNCGLLLPLESIKAAEDAYHQGQVPLNAAEGFIRQIIGWREYVRGIYWLKMPGYESENFLEAERKLPDFYWTAKTKMNCLKQSILETKKNAYAHHIQRLMVLGNFALLSEINPAEVNEWFLIVYADAYQWVELPNVSGMILFADGGYLASKPYAAGGSYINKMSNYCKNCSYKVSKKNGTDACPFNYLYWDFLVRNQDKLASNPRIAMIYKTYQRMSEEKKQAIQLDSIQFLDAMESGAIV